MQRRLRWQVRAREERSAYAQDRCHACHRLYADRDDEVTEDGSAAVVLFARWLCMMG